MRRPWDRAPAALVAVLARVAADGGLCRVTLPSGVSFVGRPRLAAASVVLAHATNGADAHVIRLRDIAAVTDVAVARPATARALDAVDDVGDALADRAV